MRITLRSLLALTLLVGVGLCGDLLAQGRGGGGGRAGGGRGAGNGMQLPNNGQNQAAIANNAAGNNANCDNGQQQGAIGQSVNTQSAQMAQQMVAQFDTNGDSALNASELQAALMVMNRMMQSRMAAQMNSQINPQISLNGIQNQGMHRGHGR